MQNYKQDHKSVNPENPPRSLVKNFLWIGIGIATLFITGKAAIFGYQQWLSHQEQLFVETMEDLIINKNFVECMNKALEIPESSHKYYNARAFLNQCAQGQLAQAEKVINDSQKATLSEQELKPVDENYKLAINLAKQIPSSTSVYNQAQDAILKWEKKWRQLVGVEGFTDGIYFYQQNKGSNIYLIFQKQGNKILGKKYGFHSDYIVCLRGVIRRDILKDLTGISYGIDFIPQVESVDPINLSKWYRISWDKISNSSNYALHYAYNNKDHHIESCQKEFDKNP
ncbi:MULTISPECIES: hypothetical protein [Moorena]|uniref:Uncharacterized protein n=1 Tax=Moorena producens (strain JHB) TaxID=1454205 RepID=A0A1D9G0B2_MOOP1|nr:MULTISPECIES: hypothetical protein [Moorena]AOY80850.1 hypothetical protein BJP36_13950 [Moorena producens JHB]NER87078.1 hypothetical protein [Moorena sp. SIO3A2]